MIPEKDLEQFARLIRALDPWLHEAVIVGGWAHRLYRYHEFAQPLGYSPLMTVDADVALPSAATLGAGDIRDRLLKKAIAAARSSTTTLTWSNLLIVMSLE